MKNLKFIVLACLALLLTACPEDIVEPEEQYQETVQEYGRKVVNINHLLEDFILKSQKYESANFGAHSAAEVKKIVSDYIESGEKFVVGVEEMNKLDVSVRFTQSGQLRSGDSQVSCSAYDFIPSPTTGGASVGVAKSVGDLIAETKGEMKVIQEKYDKGEIDDNTYKDVVDELRKRKLDKTANYTLGALVGTGAAAFTGLVVGASTLPAIATVTVVGVGVGTAVTWVTSWYRGTKSTGSGQGYYMTTGKTTVGGRLPLHMIPEGAQVSIQVDGYAPVFIPNFSHPTAGQNRNMEISTVKNSDIKKDSKAEVCVIDIPLVANSCSDIEFVNAVPDPVDPSPGQTVTVTATVIPVIGNCAVTFSIVGTDGYSDTETKQTDANGQASFFIPGAEKDVFDKVSITTSNGKSYVVTYTF